MDDLLYFQDEAGNEISVKVRKYFKVNMAVANEFATMINWDWEFVGSDVAPEEGQTQLLYTDIIANGSIAAGINDLIGLVYEAGLTEATKRDFEACIGAAEGEASGLAAETVTNGDPTFAGPLTGVSLGLKVYHVCEEEVKAEFDEAVYDEQVSMMEMVLDVDDIAGEMSSIREQFCKY